MIKIIYLIVISLLMTLLVGEGYPNYMDTSFIGMLLAIDLGSLLLLFLSKENNVHIKGQYIKTSNLFIFGFVVVHFQMYFDLFLGFLSVDNSYLFINNRIAIKSLLISSIALNAFIFGYVLHNKRASNLSEINNPPKNYKVLNTQPLFFLALFLLLIYFATVNKSYLSGNYGQVDKGEIAGYAAFIFENIISAILIIKARNLLIIEGFQMSLKKVFLYLKKEILVLSIYLLSVLVSGERDLLLLNGLFLIGIFLYSSKIKLKKSYIFLLLGIASFAFTILGISRNFRDNNASFFEKIKIALQQDSEDNYYTNSFLGSTKELASSGRTLNVAVDKIEQGASHTNGLFALQDLMLFIPSLKGTVIDVFNIPPFLTSSAQYLTYLDQGPFPIWGVGTSCVADTYLDFGVVGVLIFYFLFGFFIRKTELVLYGNKMTGFFILTIALLFFSYSIYMSRATILYSLSKLSYIIFFICLIILINNKGFNTLRSLK